MSPRSSASGGRAGGRAARRAGASEPSDPGAPGDPGDPGDPSAPAHAPRSLAPGREGRASPLTRTRTLRPLWRRLTSAGCDPSPLGRRFALPPSVATEEETIVPLHVLTEIFDEAALLLRDPALGLHMAVDYPAGTLGILEYTFRLAPTAREACRQVTRFVGLTNDLVQMAFDETSGDEVGPQHTPGDAHLRHWIVGHPLGLGRHLNEYFMALLVLQLRQLTGSPVIPKAVWFAHPEPMDLTPLEELFRTKHLEFGVEANGMTLSAATLAIALPTADPALLEILSRVANEKLAAAPPAKDFAAQVRRAIRASMQGAVPKMPTIAESFRMSERTFQRRLGDEHTSYQDLIDGVREELARVHVAESKLSLGEIAYLLGYAELSAFLRAFKRWAGVTPQAFRQRKGAAASAPESTAAAAASRKRRR